MCHRNLHKDMKSKEMGKPVYFHARFDGQVGCHDWMKNYGLIIIIKGKANKVCFENMVFKIFNY